MTHNPRIEIKLTAEMIAAGVDVLWEQYGIVGPSAAEGIAAEVFAAMIAHSERFVIKDEDQEPNPGGIEEGA